MTIKNNVEKILDKNVIATSSVWDIHNCEGLGGKGTNLHRDLKKLFLANPATTLVSVVAGGKGRSQHSKSELLIIEGSIDPGFSSIINAEFTRSYILGDQIMEIISAAETEGDEKS